MHPPDTGATLVVHDLCAQAVRKSDGAERLYTGVPHALPVDLRGRVRSCPVGIDEIEPARERRVLLVQRLAAHRRRRRAVLRGGLCRFGGRVGTTARVRRGGRVVVGGAEPRARRAHHASDDHEEPRAGELTAAGEGARHVPALCSEDRKKRAAARQAARAICAAGRAPRSRFFLVRPAARCMTRSTRRVGSSASTASTNAARRGTT